MGRAPVAYTRTEPVEVEDNDDRRNRLAAEVAGNVEPSGGLVWGLPPLPDGDMWVDLHGASALTGQATSTIRSRLQRSEKYSNPFPAPHKYFAMYWWKLSEIKAWVARGGGERTAAHAG